jgi:hypothetical protein
MCLNGKKADLQDGSKLPMEINLYGSSHTFNANCNSTAAALGKLASQSMLLQDLRIRWKCRGEVAIKLPPVGLANDLWFGKTSLWIVLMSLVNDLVVQVIPSNHLDDSAYSIVIFDGQEKLASTPSCIMGTRRCGWCYSEDPKQILHLVEQVLSSFQTSSKVFIRLLKT